MYLWLQILLAVYFCGLIYCLKYFSKQKYFKGDWPGSLQKPSEIPTSLSMSSVMLLSLLWPILPVFRLLEILLVTTFFALYYQVKFFLESDPVKKALYSMRRDYSRDPSLIDIYSPEDISRELYRRRLKLAHRHK